MTDRVNNLRSVERWKRTGPIKEYSRNRRGSTEKYKHSLLGSWEEIENHVLASHENMQPQLTLGLNHTCEPMTILKPALHPLQADPSNKASIEDKDLTE